MTTMLVAIAALSVGYFLGGYLGDFYFERTPRGRAIVGAMGVLASAVFLLLTLNVPVENAGGSLGFRGVSPISGGTWYNQRKIPEVLSC